MATECILMMAWKIGSRSQNCNQLSIKVPCCIHANFIEIHPTILFDLMFYIPVNSFQLCFNMSSGCQCFIQCEFGYEYTIT